MIIGIDGNEANVKEKVGVHTYALEILWGLHKLQDNKNTHNKFFIYLKKAPNSDLPKENSFWKYKIIPGRGLWVLRNLMPTLLRTEKLDVFFTPGHYLPFLSRCPKVLTIHDLGYLKFSGQFKKNDFWQLKYWTAISIIISKYIICPSLSTGDDIVRHYPFTRKKVKVIYHGYNKEKFYFKISKNFVRRVRKKYRIPENYLLFLSTLKPSKNIENLLGAYELLKSKRRTLNVKLVIAGKKGWMFDSIFEKVKELGLEKDVIFTDYVQENDKPALIRGAKLFVLPSFWEGFGIDVLEAMACGVVVVVSKVASLPEVVGDAGLYVDPYNIESIAEAVEKVLTMSSDEYTKLIRKGLKQAQKFTWEKAAQETLEVLELASRR